MISGARNRLASAQWLPCKRHGTQFNTAQKPDVIQHAVGSLTVEHYLTLDCSDYSQTVQEKIAHSIDSLSSMFGRDRKTARQSSAHSTSVLAVIRISTLLRPS